MTDPLILTEARGDGDRRTMLITLNRPKQLNALNDALMDQLGAYLRAICTASASSLTRMSTTPLGTWNDMGPTSSGV